MPKKIQHWNLGLLPYEESLELQKRLMNEKKNGSEKDHLITLEHPHSYTLGSTGSEGNLLVDRKYLSSNGIGLYKTGRGGDITYHGPGQLVAYPILDLNHFIKDLHRYLRDLEEVLIRTVNHYGITAKRVNALTGIWVRDDKLGSIGIRMSKWITIHGSALNVSTDLSMFENIVPCGIKDKGVTSISKILGETIAVEDVTSVYVNFFADVFGIDSVEKNFELPYNNGELDSASDTSSNLLMEEMG